MSNYSDDDTKELFLPVYKRCFICNELKLESEGRDDIPLWHGNLYPFLCFECLSGKEENYNLIMKKKYMTLLELLLGAATLIFLLYEFLKIVGR